MTSDVNKWGVGGQVTSMVGLILLSVSWVADVGRTTTLVLVGTVMLFVYGLAITGRKLRRKTGREPFPFFPGIGHWTGWRWIWFYLTLMMSIGWITTLVKPAGVHAVLGGWFHGHGNLYNKALGTITGDYTLGSTARSPDVGAVSQFGMFALTGDWREVRIWSVPAAEELCRVNQADGVIVDAIWVKQTAIYVVRKSTYSPSGLGKHELFAIDVQSLNETTQCIPRRLGTLSDIKGMCPKGEQFYILQYETNKAIRASLLDINSKKNKDEKPKMTPAGVWRPTGVYRSRQAYSVSFSPDCNWVVFGTDPWQRGRSFEHGPKARKKLGLPKKSKASVMTVRVGLAQVGTNRFSESLFTVPVSKGQKAADGALAVGTQARHIVITSVPDSFIGDVKSKQMNRLSMVENYPDQRSWEYFNEEVYRGYRFREPVRFSSDGRVFILTSRPTDDRWAEFGVHVFDAESHTRLAYYQTHEYSLSDMHIGEGGRFMMTVGKDFMAHIVKLESVKPPPSSTK